jgi:hypothetical protein
LWKVRQWHICGQSQLKGVLAMAALIHPITWLVDTLSRQKTRKMEQETDKLTQDPATETDLRYRRDTAFWFLPPPC